MDVAIVRFSFALLFLVLTASATNSAEKAVVFGTPTANLRVGPSVEQAIVVTLKEGDAVMVDKLDGDWYQVTAAEGQKGFIHKNLLKFPEPTKAPPAPTKTAATEVKEAAKAPAVAPAAVPPSVPEKPPASPNPPAPAIVAPPVAEPNAPVVKSPIPSPATGGAAPAKAKPLIALVDGREWETAIWLGFALLTFVLGWICGGIYSLRRERLKRSRLIF